MSGAHSYRLQAGWMGAPVFAGEPFNRASAWLWMIECARLERWGRGRLKRAQFAASYAELAQAWLWSVGKVRRYLDRLVSAGMITVERGGAQSIIIIHNYDAYETCGDEQHTGIASAAESADLQGSATQTDIATDTARGAEILAFLAHTTQRPATSDDTGRAA